MLLPKTAHAMLAYLQLARCCCRYPSTISRQLLSACCLIKPSYVGYLAANPSDAAGSCCRCHKYHAPHAHTMNPAHIHADPVSVLHAEYTEETQLNRPHKQHAAHAATYARGRCFSCTVTHLYCSAVCSRCATPVCFQSSTRTI